MRFPFLTPLAERLGADGQVALVHEGGTIGRLRPKVYLLARDLCTFQLFEAGALPRGRRRQAALLFARTSSPYVLGGMIVVPAGSDYGVWWWDLERISNLLPGDGATSRIRPETLAQPAGDGWRIVRLAKGFEAQVWRTGKLLASSWRQQAFDDSSWGAFVRLQRNSQDAPTTPPVPVILPVAEDGEAFAVSALEVSPRQAAMAAGGFALLSVVVLSLFFLGQGLRLADDTRGLRAEVEAVEARLPSSESAQTQTDDRRRLAAFAELEARTNPLTASGAALGIMALYNIEPMALEVDSDTLSIKVPYAALGSIDELVSELETSGYFYDVEPQTEPATQSVTLAMKIRAASPPLVSPG